MAPPQTLSWSPTRSSWRSNAGDRIAGVVHHSDRGAAYTSLAFSQRVVELEVDQSFGATGDCYDNAAVESFFATLKRELAWIHATKNWPTRSALRSALFDYIEGFYNPERIQHRLGHQSPINYEQDSAA
jgi:putative transposase